MSKRPRKRRRRLDDSKQTALLNAAIEEVAERGLEAFSIQRVASQAGITRGLVYYYWDDREELMGDVVEHFRAILSDAFQKWGAPTDRTSYWLGIETVYGQAFRSLASKPHHLEFFRRLIESAPQAPEPVKATINDARTSMLRLLEMGQELGAVRTDLPISLLLEATFALAGASDAWAIRQVATGVEATSCISATLRLVRSTIQAAPQEPVHQEATAFQRFDLDEPRSANQENNDGRS
jgi:AcrR family transcriptional regulator